MGLIHSLSVLCENVRCRRQRKGFMERAHLKNRFAIFEMCSLLFSFWRRSRRITTRILVKILIFRTKPTNQNWRLQLSFTMQQADKKADNARREFLKLGALGAAAAACGSAICSCGNKKEETGGDTVKLLSPEGEVIEVSKKDLRVVPEITHMSHEGARRGIPGRKFVMVIDLARCKNARKCITACIKMHNLEDDKEWLKLKLLKDTPESTPYWFPKVCFQCDNPPCVKVCPVDATFKAVDGVVLIDNERCIGCKFCMAACPYSSRVFNWAEVNANPKPVICSPDISLPREVGTVEKCDFCAYQARDGALPDCVTACPNGVFYYGDQNEDTVSNGEEVVRFSQLIKDRAGYRYMEDLGTEPRVWYLPPVDRIFPVERGLDDLPEDIRNSYRDVM
jgi:molybdopterin-containing oxidoreductase family iron-sulfur binding subunit